MKILVAEDTEDSRVMLELALKNEGYEVMSAQNGVEALHMAQVNPPDLIISDILMPEMDGFELCRQVKADLKLKKIPFIFYTATYTERQDEELAMALEASRFLIKPLVPDDLLMIIEEVLMESRDEELPVQQEPKKEEYDLDEMHLQSVTRKLNKKVRELEQERTALQESEEKYRHLVESVQDYYFFYSHDTDGVFTYLSPSIDKVLGCTAQEFVTHYSEYLTNNPLNKEVERHSELSIQGEEQSPYEVEIYHKDGSTHWLEVKEKPLFDDTGNVTGVEGIAHNITERMQAELALRESEETLRSITGSAQDAILMMDNDGNIAYWNDAAERIFGYQAEEVMGKKLHRLLTPERFHADQHKAFAHFRETGEGSAIGRTLELAALHKDGNEFPVEMSLSAVELHGCWYSVGVLRDITEKKRLAEELEQHRNHLEGLVAKRTSELHEAELKYRTVADFTYDWETWIDNNRDWLYCSPACERVTGYSAEEFLAKPALFLELVYPDDQPAVREHFRMHLEHVHGMRNVFFRIQHKDGTLRWIEHICHPVLDEQDNKIGLRASNRDITERKKAEDALVMARNEADSANQAKSIFLANMTHELRTPLNAILGFSQLMQNDQVATASQRENLDIINHSGNHLLQLINDILDMSKIEAGHLALELEDFDLGELIRDVTGMMRIRAEKKGLQLILDQSSNFPRFIHGDPQKLRQILINLLSNALKSTKSGGVSLRLDSDNGHTDIFMLRGEVEDSGHGIKPQDLERIFTPFEQLTDSMSQKGTGLGLAITRQFVELMEGEITAESTPGKGSLFRFTIQVQPAIGEVAESATIEMPRVLSLAPDQPAYRILIAEDQSDSQLLLQRLLEPVGFKVRIAANGEEAVALFQQWHPHLIWMDCRMPVMDGVTATRKIRKLAGGYGVKIVALTASAFKDQKNKVVEAGSDDFMRKPYRAEEIFECMARHLGVRYVYQERDETLIEEEQLLVEVTPEALASLPDELLADLHGTVQACDMEESLSIIKQIEITDPTLAKILCNLVETFNFTTLKEYLRKERE